MDFGHQEAERVAGVPGFPEISPHAVAQVFGLAPAAFMIFYLTSNSVFSSDFIRSRISAAFSKSSLEAASRISFFSRETSLGISKTETYSSGLSAAMSTVT